MRIRIFWFGLLMVLSASSLLSQELHDRVQEEFTGVETISVKGAFCKTEIVSGTNTNVSLEGEIRSVRRYQDLRIRFRQTGTQLDVWIEQPNAASGQIRGLLLLSVPAQTQVRVSNLSGSISVDGVGSGTTTLETVSGNVLVKNIPESLKIHTISGSIEGDWIGGGVVAHSVSGSISMRNVKGGCQLTSTSGQLRVMSAYNTVRLNATSGKITIADVIGDVEAKSVSGQMAISRLKGNLVATSSSGAIQIEETVGMLDLSTISGSIKGRQLVLTDHSSFKNASGEIDMAFSNDPETLSFDLKTLSGKLDVYGQMSDKQLRTGEGLVRVTGTTTSGNQSYK